MFQSPPSAEETTATWIVPDPDRFDIRVFGSEGVCFDRKDGRTHFLSEFALTTLRECVRRPMNETGLLDALGCTDQLEAHERQLLHGALDQLIALDFIKCA